jgi:hypothetical protein
MVGCAERNLPAFRDFIVYKIIIIKCICQDENAPTAARSSRFPIRFELLEIFPESQSELANNEHE